MTIAFLPLGADFSSFLLASADLAAVAETGLAASDFPASVFAAAGFAGDFRLLPIDGTPSLAALGTEALSAKCLLRFTGKGSTFLVKSSTSCQEM